MSSPPPSAASASQDLKRNVSSGLLWSGLGRVLQQVIQFGLSVVLARLLSPGDYGLMAMVMVFTGFAGMLADGGFTVALVQRQELTEAHVHTVFWLNLAASTLLAILTFFAAPWLALFYHAPTLTPIFQVIALNFILGALGGVPAALMQKRMQFKLIARNDTVSLFVSGVVGVALAVGGAGVWSLVAQSLVNSGLNTLLRCWSCRWRPRPIFHVSALKQLFGFSSHLYAFNFINYWARNTDNLVVGKFFGAPALGAYNRAIGLMLLPITQINSVISQVVFPAFASIQNDKERVKSIYLRAVGMVALFAFPIMLGMSAVARPFVETIYGHNWSGVAPILQILALVGVIQTLVNSTGWLFMSQGKSDLMFKCGIGYSTLVITSIASGVLLGSVESVALCYAAANLIYCIPWLRTAGGIIGMKVTELLPAIAGPFMGSIIMVAIVCGVQALLPSIWPSWKILLTLVFVGAAVYGAFVGFFRPSASRDLAQLLHQKWDAISVRRQSILTPNEIK